ncbi:hypothetical protein L7F22_063609 [Adiantum nelumboides]|nr:hypothetical protein [Adiantum nelumboides]
MGHTIWGRLLHIEGSDSQIEQGRVDAGQDQHMQAYIGLHIGINIERHRRIEKMLTVWRAASPMLLISSLMLLSLIWVTEREGDEKLLNKAKRDMGYSRSAPCELQGTGRHQQASYKLIT